jgi:hypothetical protein
LYKILKKNPLAWNHQMIKIVKTLKSQVKRLSCLRILVISHIGGWGLRGGPYMSMLTLTSKTRFGDMRGCQEQNREACWPKQTIKIWDWKQLKIYKRDERKKKKKKQGSNLKKKWLKNKIGKQNKNLQKNQG